MSKSEAKLEKIIAYKLPNGRLTESWAEAKRFELFVKELEHIMIPMLIKVHEAEVEFKEFLENNKDLSLDIEMAIGNSIRAMSWWSHRLLELNSLLSSLKGPTEERGAV